MKPAVRRLERQDWIRLTMRRPATPVRKPGSEELTVLGKKIGEALFDIIGFDTTVVATPGDGAAFAAATGAGLVASSYVAKSLGEPVRIGAPPSSLRAMLEAAFGGRLTVASGEDARAFGGLERRMAVRVLDRLSRAVVETFEKIGRSAVELVRRDPDLEFGWDQSGSADDLIVVEFVGEEASHRIYLQAPAMRSASLSPAGDVSEEIGSGADAGWRALVATQLGRTPVTLSAIIRHDGMTVGDVQALKAGTLLALAASPNSQIELVTHEAALFRCRLGQDEGRYTVQIVDGVV